VRSLVVAGVDEFATEEMVLKDARSSVLAGADKATKQNTKKIDWRQQ
jgi:hypothetical protein